jgi:hypothetical protein
MNFRSSGAAIGLLAAVTVAVTAGCGTVSAPPSGGGAHSTASAVPATAASPGLTPSAMNAGAGARSGCPRPAGGTLTLASNGRTYCVRVGERFDVYLRGTVASPWLEPLASSNVIVPVANGALSLAAGLTGESFAGSRPGQVLITSVRAPCAGALMQKNEAEPAGPVPKTYRLGACAPQRRFSVTVIVLG